MRLVTRSTVAAATDGFALAHSGPFEDCDGNAHD